MREGPSVHSWPFSFHPRLLQPQINQLLLPPGAFLLTDVRWQAGFGGRSLSPRGVIGLLRSFMGMLELWRAPKLTVTSAKLIVYFSVLTSFHHPSANALAGHIFIALLPRGSTEGGSAWFICKEKGRRISYLWYQKVGFPSYHLLFCFGVYRQHQQLD